MYDQLGVLAPIMMALTAASPIFRGRLADTDARWDVIAASVDDRTDEERGVGGGGGGGGGERRDERMAGGGVRRLSKSRYDSISTFIYACQGVAAQANLDKYNDIECEVDEELEKVGTSSSGTSSSSSSSSSKSSNQYNSLLLLTPI